MLPLFLGLDETQLLALRHMVINRQQMHETRNPVRPKKWRVVDENVVVPRGSRHQILVGVASTHDDQPPGKARCQDNSRRPKAIVMRRLTIGKHQRV